MSDRELLHTSVCFVCIGYDDGSVLMLTTTLNKDILSNYGVTKLITGTLYDVERKRFYTIDRCIKFVNVYKTKEDMYIDRKEIDCFANRFI